MTALQAIILGIIQGLTEFLPISSSGHLVIIPYILGWEIPAEDVFVFDVLVQVATLIAVFAYFWGDIKEICRDMILSIYHRTYLGTHQARLGWHIILSTLPAGFIGLLLKDYVERAFLNPTLVSFFLFLTAGLLIIAEAIGARDRNLQQMDWKDAVWIGFFQAAAIFPGISRSGAAITGGMIRNLKRTSAARYSFLISIPIMLAAGFSAIYDLVRLPNLGDLLPVYIPGFIVSALVGYLTIKWLLDYLSTHSFYIFAVYCAALGILILGYSFFQN
jgi:undecaprenyl-diphosphatase